MGMNPRLLRPTPTGFDPRRIANLGLWLDATVDSSLTFNGNTVSEWRDLSGNGRHFAQGTAGAQPDGVTRTQNGRRVLDFDATRFMTGNAASLTTLRNVPGATAVIVARLDQTSRNGAFFNFSTAVGVSFARFQMGQSTTIGGTYVGGRRLDANSFAATPFSDNTNSQILTGVLNYSAASAFIYSNGSLQASNTSFQTSGNSDDTSHAAVSLANNSNTLSGSQPHDGWIGEMLVWSRALADLERQRVERYLGRKWGITVA
jgi:hypothetical protein